jgi:hypothetical protein
MSDTRRTTKGFLGILQPHIILSSNGRRRFGKLFRSRAAVLAPLMLLAIATVALTGCELLPEVGEEGAALAPEAEAPLPEAAAAAELAGVEAAEWPWIEHEVVIVDPFESRVIDARTGELLGQVKLASDQSYVDVLKPGERVPSRFRIEGALDSSEPVKLLNRGGNVLATARRMADGRFLVRALDGRAPVPRGEPFVPFAGGANRKRKDPTSGQSGRNPQIVLCTDRNGRMYYVNGACEDTKNITGRHTDPGGTQSGDIRLSPKASQPEAPEWHHFGPAPPGAHGAPAQSQGRADETHQLQATPATRNNHPAWSKFSHGYQLPPACRDQPSSNAPRLAPIGGRSNSAWQHFKPPDCPK